MYSISLILFILLFQNHPLEGKCSINIYLTPQLTEKLYGNEPLFIYDPFNDSNRPVEKLHQSVIDLWQTVPNYINDIFLKAFSQESLMNTVKRPVDSDWINVLVRLNSELMKCECGNELFISQQSTCDNCGKKITIDNYFKINQYRIPITKDMTLYKCQLGMYDTVNALKPIGAIIEKLDKTQMLGLKNLTNSVITATTPSGKHKSVQPNEIVPIKEGIDFEIFEERIVIV